MRTHAHTHIHTHTHTQIHIHTQTYIYIYIYIYISLCRAASMDLPDSLSSPVSIVHRTREVFQATSCIGTELLYIGSSWSSNLCLSVWRNLQENVTYEIILTSRIVSCMSGSSLIIFVMGGRWPYNCCFLRFASGTSSILLAAFLCNCCQDFSPSV